LLGDGLLHQDADSAITHADATIAKSSFKDGHDLCVLEDSEFVVT
jgi:hypothetical protein